MKIILALILFSAHAFAFDHTHKQFDELLKMHTKVQDGATVVDYKSIKASPEILKNYLSSLESLNKDEFTKFSSDEKLAFWINVYNAYTIQLIVDHYPVKSIKDIGSFFSKPWSKEIIPLFGKKMTLDEVEHDTIRVDFKEPRIHFAVNCASIGCPSLYREAFQATNLDQQLDAATKFFLNNRSKNKIKGDTVYISKIFKWYGKDFKRSHGSVKKFLESYWSEVKKTDDIDYLDYDWGLNQY